MLSRPRKIGVFDSGVGGLTVYKELLELLPDESFLYLGDTARVPYGIRSPETICKYSLQNCLFLLEKGAELIVVACNTATASALPYLQSVLQVPVMGVIEPGVRTALKTTRSKRVGVIATETTIRSGVYETELKARDASLVCLSQATPLFVPLVEEGVVSESIFFPIFDHYLKVFKRENIDTLILGCTHYPILKPYLQRYLGDGITLVDSAHAMAETVKDYLVRFSEKPSYKDQTSPLFVTDAPERVGRIAEKILGGRGLHIEKVEV